jgi:hypothetical protein
MGILAVGGPLDGQVLDETSAVVWGARKPSYFLHLIWNGVKCQWLYLHKSAVRSKPQPETVIRSFVMPDDCCASQDWDLEVIAHHWWLMGDDARYSYTRFLIR